MNKRVCYVSAYLDIGRSNWKTYKRTTEYYIECFMSHIDMFLNNLDIINDYEMIVYIDNKYYDLLKIKIYEKDEKSILPIKLIPINEKWLNENLVLWKRLEKEKKVMEKEEFKILLGNRKYLYPECWNAKYTLINHSKIDFVCHSIKNYTNAEYICWCDFGYHANKDRIPKKLIDINKLCDDKIIYTMINPIQKEDLNIYFTLYYARETFGGFFFIGKKEKLLEFQKLYHEIHLSLLNNNICDDDQGLLTQIYAERPNLFKLYNLGIWHQALNYFQINE
jgi:hypothetical protein